MAPPQENP
jgi:hypothetical protein